MDMKIAITATGASLDAQVDPRFGRCPCFLVIDTDSMDFEAIENPNVALGGGAGIQSAQLMAGKDVQFVLTGNCGPNAYQALSAAGIQIIVGCSGLIRESVERFKAGGLDATGAPNVASHHGMGAALDSPQDVPLSPQQGALPGTGMGQGMGRGMGMGMGRGGGGGGGGRGGGRGMGRGRGMGMAQGFQAGPAPGSEQPAAQNPELTMLRQQAQAMQQGLKELEERICQLSNEEGGNPA
jgi:predicted Fe-Mo cluster-binding NifX family protein